MWSRNRWWVRDFGLDGIVLRRRGREQLQLAYSEILTAERAPTPWGLKLHARGASRPLRVACTGKRRLTIETELRSAGVRIVDEYGAMITPTLADFEGELVREPARLRQSSDNA